jgi:16S rRNA (adenine1518-N6/adenine1519-N6)-dimethyltransferase
MFAPACGDRVIEIGPGGGVLTSLLLDAGALVTAVEVDQRLAQDLEARLSDRPGLELIHDDILRCDIRSLTGGRPTRVLANLPYAISGEVLAKLLCEADTIVDMMLMLQREVVDRLVSEPGVKAYGSLSVLAQYFTEPRRVMRLAPGSFTPPPAVHSAVVAMPFRSDRELPPGRESAYPRFIRILFGRRRRTILNNLKTAGYARAADLSASAGIEPGRRPETLSRAECVALFEAVTGRETDPADLL